MTYICSLTTVIALNSGFEPADSPTETLKRRLRQEEDRVAELQTENEDLRREHILLEHERDLYLGLIRRMRSNVRRALERRETHTRARHVSEDPLDSTTHAVLNEANRILSSSYRHSTQIMEVDHEDMDLSHFAMEEDEEETSEEASWDANLDQSMASESGEDMMALDRTVRAQSRTISIADEDTE